MESEKELFEEYSNLISKLGDGSEELMKYLMTTNFFKSPASIKYHLSEDHGLVKHSLNVYNVIRQLNTTLCNNKYTDESLIKVALCHEFGKIGLFEKYLKNEKHDGQWVQVEAYKSTDSKDRYVVGDCGFTSYMIASRYIPFNDEEIAALCNFMHIVNINNYMEISTVIDKYNLTLLLHIADMVATYIVEKK